MQHQAHHDGSSLYVSELNPTLGQQVTLRVRVRKSAGITAVAIRSLLDAEPAYTPCILDSAPPVAEPENSEWQWYRATITIRNHVHSYRILLQHDHGYWWLNAEGIFDHDVSDIADFKLTTYGPAPQWARAGVLYQIFPDRFARSENALDVLAPDADLPDWAVPRAWGTTPQGSAPETPYELYGGDLPGITEHLDYLQDLGITCVYLTPIFPARSNHRYDAESFHTIDPILGGDHALAELAQAVHRRGMTIMGDLTTNHTGVSHEWFQTASKNPNAPERDFYYWNDSELGYEAWLGVSSLPKLNWASRQLRETFIEGPDSVVGKWLQEPYRLDGWRIDVAHMTGRRAGDDFYQEVQQTVRKTMDSLVPEGQSYLAAEYFHDPTGDLAGDGWHANMNYSGFTRPIWNWLVRENTTVSFLGVPTPIPRRTGPQVIATISAFQSHMPWKVQQAQWNMLDSHDTPRIRTVVGTIARAKVAAVAQLTFPGVPVLFAGDELGGQGTNGEHSRTTMPWRTDSDGRQLSGLQLDESAFVPESQADIHADDDATHLGATVAGSYVDLRAHYRALITLRSAHPAFTEGGMRWVLAEDDAIGFMRETADEQILVLLTRGPWSGEISAADLGLFGADSAAADVLFSCGGARVAAGAWAAAGARVLGEAQEQGGARVSADEGVLRGEPLSVCSDDAGALVIRFG